VEDGALDAGERFEEDAPQALASLPSELRARVSNVELVIEVEPLPSQRLLGLYQGGLRLVPAQGGSCEPS
jgi:predicted Zn-dependent protease with MMP-like domain